MLSKTEVEGGKKNRLEETQTRGRVPAPVVPAPAALAAQAELGRRPGRPSREAHPWRCCLIANLTVAKRMLKDESREAKEGVERMLEGEVRAVL